MKIRKVIFEYEDETHSLSGEEAQRWLDAANGMAIMQSVHGRPFPQFKWKIVKKKPVNLG